MSYYTYLWKNETWERKSAQSRNGYSELDYAASDQFSSKGVRNGATIFIVTVKKGVLFLGGYIEVSVVTNIGAAAKALGRKEGELWKAGEYALAEKGKTIRFRENLRVDDATAKGLEFSNGNGGFVNLKLDTNGKIDRQTLRGVRQLYRDEEKKLFSILRP